MELAAPEFGARMFTMAVSSWLMVPLIGINCPLLLPVSFGLKSVSLDITTAAPTCFLVPLASIPFSHPFTMVLKSGSLILANTHYKDTHTHTHTAGSYFSSFFLLFLCFEVSDVHDRDPKSTLNDNKRQF